MAYVSACYAVHHSNLLISLHYFIYGISGVALVVHYASQTTSGYQEFAYAHIMHSTQYEVQHHHPELEPLSYFSMQEAAGLAPSICQNLSQTLLQQVAKIRYTPTLTLNVHIIKVPAYTRGYLCLVISPEESQGNLQPCAASALYSIQELEQSN